MNRIGQFIDDHGLWPVVFVVVMILWAMILDSTIGLDTIRRLLGWTIGPGV